MLESPLLIGHSGSKSPLRAVDRALEQGCDGVGLDLQPPPFGSSRANQTRKSSYPSLHKLFEHSADRLFLDIGVRVKGMEAEILDVLRCRPRQNYMVSSALPEVVMELKARSAMVPVGIVCRRAGELVFWRTVPADYVIVHHPMITRKLIRLIHGSGRKIFAWMANDVRAMTRLAAWEVDGIISNRPQLLVQTLG